MVSKVYLIGEHHLDLFKPYRYLNAIQKFKPDFISLEQSEASDFRKNLDNSYRLLKDKPLNFIANASLMANCAELGLELYNKKIGKKDIKLSYSDPYHKEVLDKVNNSLEDLSKIDGSLNENLFESEEKPSILDRILCRVVNKKDRILLGNDLNLILSEIYRITLEGKTSQILKTQFWLDCFYFNKLEDYFDSEILNESMDELKINERDNKILENILSKDGVVLHQGGLGHIYRSDNKNLYEKLKIKNVPVKRYKLIDFTSKFMLVSYLYKSLIGYKLRKIKKI